MSLEDKYTLSAPIGATLLVCVYRGFRKSDGLGVVAKVLRDEHPSEVQLALLRHEHQIIASLDVSGVVLGSLSFW
jgi:hypothetical protein